MKTDWKQNEPLYENTSPPFAMTRNIYFNNCFEIENNILFQKSSLRSKTMKNFTLSKFDVYTIVFFRKLIYGEKVATMYDLSVRQEVFLIFYFLFSEINKFPWKNYQNKSDSLLHIDNIFWGLRNTFLLK